MRVFLFFMIDDDLVFHVFYESVLTLTGPQQRCFFSMVT